MTTLSQAQRDILVKLKAGFRITYKNMVTVRWLDPRGAHAGIPDMRSVHGLWLRLLVELDRDAVAGYFFVITAKGLAALSPPDRQ